MRKRTISLVVLITMVCTLFMNVYAGSDNYKYFTEEDIRQFNQQVGFLKAMDIFDASNLDISSTINRIEYAKMLTKLMKADLAADGIDVSLVGDIENDSAKYAAFAVYAGLMKNNSNNEFEPERKLTYNEAVYGLVRLLGYGILAEEDGNTPVAYSVVAKKIGVTDGTDVYGEYPVILGVLLRMIDNSLEIDFCGKELGGDSYVITPGKTIMSEYLSAKKLRGILYSTGYAHIIRENGVGEGRVDIEGKRYYVNTDYSSLLGLSVDYYVIDDKSGMETVIYMCASSRNEVMTLPSKDVQMSGTECTYYENDKKRTMNLESDFLTMYNGSALPVPTQTELQPQNGFFEFIDNDDNGNIDVIKITSYTHYVVGSVEADNNKIYDKYTPTHKLDLTDFELVRIYSETGATMELSNITADDVVTAIVNKSKTIAELFVSRRTIEGAVTLIRNDEGDKIEVGGTEYEIAADYTGGDEISVLSQGLFRLNKQGQIISFEKGADELKYGYYIDSVVTGVFTKELKVKLFSQDGDMIIAPVAEKPMIDEVKYKDAETAYNALKKGYSEPQPQLVQYKLVDGKFTEIITPYNNYLWDEGTDPMTSVPPATRDKESLRVLRRKNTYYSSLLNTLGNVGVGDDTVKFIIPNSPKNADVDEFGVVKGISTQTNYTCELFSADESNIAADAMIIFGSSGGTTNIGVVASIEGVLDSEGEACTRITTYCYPELTETIYTYNNEEDAVGGLNDGNTYQLDVGDTIQYSTIGIKNKVKSIKLLCDASADGMNRMKCTNPSGGLTGVLNRYSYGAINEKSGRFFQLAFCDPATYPSGVPTDLTELYTIKGMYEIVVDTTGRRTTVERNKYGAMDFKDYKSYSHDCDYGFVYLCWGNARFVVVYK